MLAQPPERIKRLQRDPEATTKDTAGRDRPLLSQTARSPRCSSSTLDSDLPPSGRPCPAKPSPAQPHSAQPNPAQPNPAHRAAPPAPWTATSPPAAGPAQPNPDKSSHTQPIQTQTSRPAYPVAPPSGFPEERKKTLSCTLVFLVGFFCFCFVVVWGFYCSCCCRFPSWNILLF